MRQVFDFMCNGMQACVWSQFDFQEQKMTAAL